MSRRSDAALGLIPTALALLAGCQQGPPPAAAPPLPVVPVSQPVQRQVTDYVDYTGRTGAKQSVDIRARVTGYLVVTPFHEGAEVNKGDLLFKIDPRPYQDQLDAAQAQVGLAEAQLALAKATLQRDQTIAAAAAGSVSRQQLDQDQAAVSEAQASISAAKANVEIYRLNLEFTDVKSPIDGQVSRYYLTPGNLVIADQTLLTTVVSLDPMYVYFDMDERTVLNIRTAINEGKIPAPADATAIPVDMGLENEKDYPHHGTLDFVNNAVNPSTGTVVVRGVFENPKPPKGRRLLMPGMFARIHLPIGPPHPALLVIDRAVGSDQGLKFVYVLDAHNTVQYRSVTTGPLEPDGLRVIDKGLSSGDWVVVGALTTVRPRMPVEPDRMPMPTIGAGEVQPSGGGPLPPPPGEKRG